MAYGRRRGLSLMEQGRRQAARERTEAWKTIDGIIQRQFTSDEITGYLAGIKSQVEQDGRKLKAVLKSYSTTLETCQQAAALAAEQAQRFYGISWRQQELRQWFEQAA